MSRNTTFVATITRLERLNSSRNGNPRYRVHTDGPTHDTEPDSAIAYGLPNPEFRDVPVTFTVNGRGWITDAVPTTKESQA